MKVFRKARRPMDVTTRVVSGAREEVPADWREFKSQILADKKHGRLPRGGSDWVGPTAVVVPAIGRTRPLIAVHGDVVRELDLSDAEARIAVKLGIYSAELARSIDPILVVKTESEPEGYESDADVEAQYSLLGKLVRHLPVAAEVH